MAPSRTTRPQSVFISYARDDARPFVQRLAADLERLGGHQVWVDLSSIEKGGLFEVRIEEGIRACSVFTAVMTRRSVAETSVCRDEVVYALNEGKAVVPLRLDPDPRLRPTLLLARRNWVDFTAGYDAGLRDLLQYLSGDESALRDPRVPRVAGLAPLDFGVEIAKFSAGFVGRTWLGQELDRWLARDGPRVFVLVAEPGVGKSAIAAWLGRTRGDVVGVHFCTQQNTRSRNPYEFVACLVGQLSAELPGLAEAVGRKHPETPRPRAADAFRELVVEPLRDLPAPAQRLVFIVDSLDEAMDQEGETVVDVLVAQAPDLPPWLRIVATTRPEERVLRRIRNLTVAELPADRLENRQDLDGFVRSRLGSVPLAERIVRLAEGNFLYARLVLDAIGEGTLSEADVGRLSPGLAVFYGEAFRRRFGDAAGYSADYAPLLRALAVARGHLPFVLLQRVSGAPAEAVRGRLRELRSFLRVTGQGEAASYSLFHKSLRDWLADPEASGEFWCQPCAGHAALAEALLADWPRPSRSHDYDYFWASLGHHVFEAGDAARLRQVVSESYLAEKVRRLGYAVLEDVELLTRSLLDAGDAALVEQAVALVEGLRRVVGGDVIETARRGPRLSRAESGASAPIAPELPPTPGLDVCVRMIPKAEVGADFFDVIPGRDGTILAVGDAPGTGLKSAFVANVLRRLAEDAAAVDLGQVLLDLNRRISTHAYFEVITLQCVRVDPAQGLLCIANAGHPWPVLFSRRRGQCARLPVRGEPLHARAGQAAPRYEERHAEIGPGDVLVLVTDGLTEGHLLAGDPYGYRFERVVERLADCSARAIAEAILADWLDRPARGSGHQDDATLLVAKVEA